MRWLDPAGQTTGTPAGLAASSAWDDDRCPATAFTVQAVRRSAHTHTLFITPQDGKKKQKATAKTFTATKLLQNVWKIIWFQLCVIRRRRYLDQHRQIEYRTFTIHMRCKRHVCKNTHKTSITKQDARKHPPSVQLSIYFMIKIKLFSIKCCMKWERLENQHSSHGMNMWTRLKEGQDLELKNPEPGSTEAETSNEPQQDGIKDTTTSSERRISPSVLAGQQGQIIRGPSMQGHGSQGHFNGVIEELLLCPGYMTDSK